MSDQDLRSYMFRFPGSFIGFLDSVANILKSLGDDWFEANEKEYADVFHSASQKILEVSSTLVKISDDYTKRQTTEEPKSIVKSLAAKYREKVVGCVK